MAAFFKGFGPAACHRAARPMILAIACLSALQGCAGLDGLGDSGRRNTTYGDYLAGRHAALSYEPQKAQRYFIKALEAEPENALILEHAFTVTVNAGDMDEAIKLARRLVKVTPDNRLAHLVLAIADIKNEKYPEAIAEIGESKNVAFVAVVGSLVQAWAAAGLGDTKLVEQKLDSLSISPVFDAFRSYHEALILDMTGNAEAAAAAYDNAMENTSYTSLRIALAYASFLERQGQRDRALEELRQFNIISPDHPLLLDTLSGMEAGKALPQLVSNPVEGAAEVFYGLGSLLTQDEGNNLASIYLQFSLYLRPDFDIARTLLADAYEDQERWQAAIDVYDDIDSASPLKENARIRTALILVRQEKIDEATALFDQIAEDDPKAIQPLIAFGDFYRSKENYAEALKQYDKAIALLPEPTESRWTLYYARGICYERLKQWPAAEKDLKLALELSEENPMVLNYLGYSWVEQGRNLHQAMEMIEKAVDQRPSDGFIVDSLGWAYYRLGDYTNAVQYLQQAVVLQPADPTINEHLGDAFWMAGRRLEAKFQWSHALEMDPAEDRVESLKAKIERGLKEENAAPSSPSQGPDQSGGAEAPAS